MKKLFCVTATLLATSVFAGNVDGQVTPERLLNSAKEPQNWLTYSGDYAGHRFSALDQINKANAHALAPKWVYQTLAADRFETTPLVVDGILYGTGPDNRAFALDIPAATAVGHPAVLRKSEPRGGDSGQQSLYGDAGRARDCAGCEDGKCDLGRGGD
jgi:glucose dehydrogenase